MLGVDRTMVRYRSQRGDDAHIRERMKGLAADRRRFGYRRLHWLLGVPAENDSRAGRVELLFSSNTYLRLAFPRGRSSMQDEASAVMPSIV